MTTLLGHTKAVKVVKFIQRDKLLSGSADGSCKYWSLYSGLCIYTLFGHIDPVTSIKVWSDFMFLSGSDNGSVKVWDLSLLECIKTLSGSQNCLRNKCSLFLLNKKI